MSEEGYLLSIVRDERRGPDAKLIGGVLAGLSHVYNMGLDAYLLPYRTGIRRRTTLPCPVLSVGNLTVGGTGKTPMTHRICEFLHERGLRVCVLSRGYRGANEHGVAVVSNPQKVLLNAKAAGDEPYLLAKLLPGVPVLVGKDRRLSGRLACEQFKPDVIVLDDGMQFYQLHRDLEIVLVDARRPFDNGWTFPRGLMREPPSHLRRGDCVVLTNSDRVEAGELARLRTEVAHRAAGVPVYAARYAGVSLRALDRSGDHPANWLAGRQIVSFCALGNPAGFEEQLEREGAVLGKRYRFPDHHEPTLRELETAIAEACALGAEAIVVSEKDAVKIPPIGRPITFYAFIARQQLDDEPAFFAQVLRALGDRQRRG